MPTREQLLARARIEPPVSEVLRGALGAAVSEGAGRAALRGDAGIVALDAGCGRRSALLRHRATIRRLVGVDLRQPPPGTLEHFDEFVDLDICRPSQAFAPATFDLVLSTFTLEHFGAPAIALGNLRCWLRPGGALILTTVNRRHPFVAAYLALPERLRSQLQRIVKADAADAHRLVGACNDPAAIRETLGAAGFASIEIATVGNLARAWGRHWPTFLLGLAGDLLARDMPGRRSTLVVSARVPAITTASAA